SLTMTSKVVKHGYSPPEQYSSDIRKIGFQSDIYALGATFYKVLSGRDPVYALERTIDGTPLPPIGEELAPSRARAAIHSAMSLEIGERPKSVEIFRKELESTLKEQKKGLMDYLPHTMWYAGFCVLWMTLVLAIYLWQQSR
ncbi:MAG: hypothetical protein LBP21_09880, partial [Synergistaceae bacterium]|nr:hypothetical protein [Synergistaceae bacterium]